MTVGLLIDLQERLVPALNEQYILMEKAEVLTKGLQLLDVPIIATEQYPKGLGQTVESLKGYLEEDNIFEKTAFNALTKEVKDYLDQVDGLSRLVVYGAEAHICVYQTVKSLLETYPGVKICLASDAIASRYVTDKREAISQCRVDGASIMPVETILFEIMEDSKHPNFKQISNLIK